MLTVQHKVLSSRLFKHPHEVQFTKFQYSFYFYVYILQLEQIGLRLIKGVLFPSLQFKSLF